jgi:periplasmic protein TonB
MKPPSTITYISLGVSLLFHSVLVFITQTNTPTHEVTTGMVTANQVPITFMQAPQKQKAPHAPPKERHSRTLQSATLQKHNTKQPDKATIQNQKDPDKERQPNTTPSEPTKPKAQEETKTPPNYLKNPFPKYPDTARRQGQEGTVILRVTIDPTGRPRDIMVQSSSGFTLLDDAAKNTVKDWRFIAATTGGLPTETSIDIPIIFKIEKR